jgi:hypothetical protein
MTEQNTDGLNRNGVLFSQGHEEQLILAKDAEDETLFPSLREVLARWGYVIDSVETLTSDRLEGICILVVGAPRCDFKPEEIDVIEQFVRDGGGLLLVSNAEAMFDPPCNLNQRIAKIAGLQFQEYLNYPITYLQVFQPHYITANVKRVKVGKVASLSVSNGARPLASTRATQQPVMACASVEKGRVVAIGDVGWLTDDLLVTESNETLAANVFRWLATRNIVDIEKVVVPEIVKWGQSTRVILHLRNSDEKTRPHVECILESDADALIARPARKRRSIPPGKTTRIQWDVQPQALGEQELRLSVHIDEHTLLFFDQLPEMHCLAPGYFTLKVESEQGELKTNFQTGDCLAVEGAFHWTVESEQLPYQLELQFGDGLMERGCESGSSVTRWHLQAVSPGAHDITLKLIETGQALPALVKVVSSYESRLAEIQAAYVCPLEAEITERVKWVDEMLSHIRVRSQPFTILPPEDLVKAVYTGEAASWLQGVLAAARREQWYNSELLELILTYIAPTYLPGCGSFVPYDPSLASHLARLHPADSKLLEYNFLCSNESDEISIKQNVAAYLLHEKFGHGFFYTQTRLGQQLTLLQRFGLLDGSGQHTEHKVAELIEDSAIIVNEGFAAWMELTFLHKLDHEVRQAIYPRWVLLIQQADGLFRRKRHSAFFQKFHPRFDSRYREGFEYLDFDLGIAEDVHGELHFGIEPAEIERRLLEPEMPGWRSHFRLRKMADWLYEHYDEADALAKCRHSIDCHRDECPLESLEAFQ